MEKRRSRLDKVSHLYLLTEEFDFIGTMILGLFLSYSVLLISGQCEHLDYVFRICFVVGCFGLLDIFLIIQYWFIPNKVLTF